MKKILSFIIAALILFMLGAHLAVAADGSENTDISSVDSGGKLTQDESSGNISPSGESTVFEEPANKRFAWLYILIAFAAVVIVIAVIVYISRKQ